MTHAQNIFKMTKIHKIVQYKPPESDKKFAFPPRTFQKSLLSSPSETSLALYSLEYCLLNLFFFGQRERERERKRKTGARLLGNHPLTSELKSNGTEGVLRPGLHVSRYFLIRNFFFPDTASVHTHPAN